MMQLIRVKSKQAFARLREGIQHVLDQWLRDHWRPSAGPLHEEVRETLNRWLPDWWGQKWEEDDTGLPSFLTTGGPVVDVEETDSEVVVFAEMPGLAKKDVTVELSGGWLMLQGEKKHLAEERRSGLYYTERGYGAFARVIPLPCEVEADKVKAKYKNGVLRVALPKTEQAKARRIKVRVG